MELRFRILNVFTTGSDPLSGNPLCVFEDATGLSERAMQALARQFNLSESTFLLAPKASGATARVRIFTPTFEMPFAGHPTLGTAHVVRELASCGDRLVLEMKAGLVEVTASGDVWRLRTARAPCTRAVQASAGELAGTLGVDEACLGATPLWVNTGAEQLVVPLTTVAAVERAQPDARLLARHAFSAERGESMAYVWARESSGVIVARMFFLSNGGVVEDPATGSACANLGGWMLATSEPLPVSVTVRQGDAVGRPSRLELHVDEAREIFVSGRVVEIGRGVISLPAP